MITTIVFGNPQIAVVIACCRVPGRRVRTKFRAV